MSVSQSFGGMLFVSSTEAVHISESPLCEIPLYLQTCAYLGNAQVVDASHAPILLIIGFIIASSPGPLREDEASFTIIENQPIKISI